MSGIDTPEIKHDLRLLHECQTCRYRLLVTVGGKENNLAVGSDTDGLTRILLCIIFILLRKRYISTIYQHFVDTDGFLYISLIRFIFLGVADLDRAILHDCKICRAFFAGYIIAVHDEHTRGFSGGHVIVGCVDACYYGTMVILVTCSRFFIKSRHLFGELGHAV